MIVDLDPDEIYTKGKTRLLTFQLNAPLKLQPQNIQVMAEKHTGKNAYVYASRNEPAHQRF